MTDRVVWCGGRLRSADEPLVRATDRALTTGLGVYESLAVIDGQPFAPTRHLRRLGRSAEQVGVDVGDVDQLRQALTEVATVGGWAYGRLRVTVTAGESDDAPGVVVVTGGPASAVAQVTVARVPYRRNDTSATVGAKVISVADNALAARAARRAGADEAALANTRGELCECTTSNVWVERDGELVTPPLSSGCLGGVTRSLVLEWCPQWGVEAREQTLPYEVLDGVAAGTARLAVTSTVRTVVPVVALDGVPVPVSGQVARVRELFLARRRDDLDP